MNLLKCPIITLSHRNTRISSPLTRSWRCRPRWVNLRQTARLRHAAEGKEKIRWMSAIPASPTGASSSNVARPRTANWTVATSASVPDMVSLNASCLCPSIQWNFIGMMSTVSEVVVEIHILTQMVLLYRSDPEWTGNFLEYSACWPHRPDWPGVFSVYEVSTTIHDNTCS